MAEEEKRKIEALEELGGVSSAIFSYICWYLLMYYIVWVLKSLFFAKIVAAFVCILYIL